MSRGDAYGPLLATAERLANAADQFEQAVSQADPEQYLRFSAWIKLQTRMTQAKDAFETWMAAQPDDKEHPRG